MGEMGGGVSEIFFFCQNSKNVLIFVFICLDGGEIASQRPEVLQYRGHGPGT